MGFPLRSNTVPYAAGRATVALDFLQRRGPRDARAVIDRIDLVISADLTTGAGVTLDKKDLVGILEGIEVYDAGGVRRNFPGHIAQAWAQYDLGERCPEAAAAIIANTANQLRTIVIPLCFRRPNEYAADDFALPCDDLMGGQFVVTWATDAQMKWAGGTGTINAATTSLQVVCWTTEEGDTQFKARDEINFVEMETASAFRIPVNGSLLDAAFIQKTAAGGGTAVTTITDVTIEAIRQFGLPRAALKAGYMMDRGVCLDSADDLVFNDLLQPLFWQPRWTKMRNRPQFPATLMGRLTSTMAVGRVTYRLVTPKDVRVMQAAAIANGLDPKTQVRVKTKGKSQRDRAGWKGGEVYMPEKAVE